MMEKALYSLREYFVFMTYPRKVKTSTGTDTVFEWDLGEQVQPDTGGGSVGNTHFSDT
jgi:hypothetical protein